jgi:DNA adenine methylase
MPQPKIHQDDAARSRHYRRMQKLRKTGALCAPFPYWGGKARVAPVIWQHLGDVRHYLEPFAGSLAVLLARPHRPRVETVNDRDGHLVNVWRAIARDPLQVARYAQGPVASIELWSRHDVVCSQRGALTAQLIADSRYYDAELAGLWVYCASTWVGSGFGRKPGLRPTPHVSHTGSGIHTKKRRGQLPRLFTELQMRLHAVRILCGGWQDCLTDTLLCGASAPAGILLDPPYTHTLHRDMRLYATEDDCAPAVRAWALQHGNDDRLRIALCGLDGEHQMPEGWRAHHWQARGGMVNTKHHGRGRGETRQEVVWFSPHCLQPAQLPLHLREDRP